MQRALERHHVDGVVGPANDHAVPESTSEERTELTAEFYSGLLPHPDHLARFEALHPGSTGRIIGWVESQGTHRQVIEKSFVRTNGISQVLGVIFGGLFVLGALAGAVYLLANNKPTAGYITMVSALVPVAIGFVRVRAKQQAEKDAKTYGREGNGRSVVGARRTRS